eukprot:CAMPEP_0197311322 /NCGR_PEP_ID=MMETSP0891-20130614/9809_1 /TAXON_ID=44058 ORGANISM="Aureoumbra lagunensis, Strain CCMP1510" /NCGR_SAMPLE_ID=MMETSP0891 /ASSEMBLY_ACC=CAM_ASM_000534 /LENGTH=601 /DNA_ID=CAMNT_0042797391 /DNA_START=2508 /DNA_END=4313 /DNA_ORIENTATION=+
MNKILVDPISIEIGSNLMAFEIARLAMTSKYSFETALDMCNALCVIRGAPSPNTWCSSEETALDALRFLEARDKNEYTFAAFSARHAIFISESQQVFACGRVADGRCGLSEEIISKNCQHFRDDETRAAMALPMQLPHSNNKMNIFACAAGAGHSILICTTGIVLSCGRGAPRASNASHGLPRRMATRATTLKTQQEEEDNYLVEQIDENSNLKIDTSTSYYQEQKSSPSCVTLSHCDSTSSLATISSQHNATPIALRLCGARMRIIIVSASANHALFVTACGSALSSGVGALGRLGHGNEANVNAPKRIRALEGECIIKCAAGAAHSLFVTARGSVYACGQGEDGRLGLGPPGSNDWNHQNDQQNMFEDFEDEGYSPTSWIVRRRRATLRSRGGTIHPRISNHIPTVSSLQEQQQNNLDHVPAGVTSRIVHLPKLISRFHGADAEVVQVAAGAYHSLFVTKRGYLFSCGDNDSGQLGHNRQNSFAPEQVFLDDQDEQIFSVAAGQAHTVVSTVSGAAYAWGSNMRGALGLGIQAHNGLILRPTKLPDNFGGPIEAVVAGGSSTALKVKNHIFVCGANSDGQLGLGHFNDVYEPTKLPPLA